MERGEEVLVVYLRHVARRDLTDSMAVIIRACTYLRWAERGPEADCFWDRLKDALRRNGDDPNN